MDCKLRAVVSYDKIKAKKRKGKTRRQSKNELRDCYYYYYYYNEVVILLIQSDFIRIEGNKAQAANNILLLSTRQIIGSNILLCSPFFLVILYVGENGSIQ